LVEKHLTTYYKKHVKQLRSLG